jgi:hypothetical protein
MVVARSQCCLAKYAEAEHARGNEPSACGTKFHVLVLLYRADGRSPPLGITFLGLIRLSKWNLTASQRAMAAAAAWAMAEREGRVQSGAERAKSAQRGQIIRNPRDHFAALFGVGKNYVEMARALLRDDPPGADLVSAHDRGKSGERADEAGQHRDPDQSSLP